eukprot:g14012.t1
MGSCCGKEQARTGTDPAQQPPKKAWGTAVGSIQTKSSRTSGKGPASVRPAPQEDAKRERQREAAERRQQQNATRGNVSLERSQKMLEKATKEQLCGEIEEHCRRKGQEPPLGLPLCSVAQLREKRKQQQLDKDEPR